MKKSLLLLGMAMVAVLSSCSNQNKAAPEGTEEASGTATSSNSNVQKQVCDDSALAVFLDIQRAISEGDYNTFSNHFGKQYQAMGNADPQTMRKEFGTLVQRYGETLRYFFERDNYICINDYTTELDCPRIWNRVYWVSKGKEPQLVFPSREMIQKVDPVQKTVKEFREQSRCFYLMPEEQRTDEQKAAQEQRVATMHELDRNTIRPLQDQLELENMPKELVDRLRSLYSAEQLGLTEDSEEDAEEENRSEGISSLPFGIAKDRKEVREGEWILTFSWDVDGFKDEEFGFDIALAKSADGKWELIERP